MPKMGAMAKGGPAKVGVPVKVGVPAKVGTLICSTHPLSLPGRGPDSSSAQYNAGRPRISGI